MIPNNSAIQNIKRIVKSGRIPHSFLIEGGSFEERTETATYLAKAIVCEGEDKPCNECRQCKITDSSSNVDIIFVGTEDGKKIISVGQIRNLRTDAFIKPHSAQKKVYVIKNAELMNEQAQNALLKVLEEPPTSVVFILLSPSRTLELVTIVSRCSILTLSQEITSDKELEEEAKKIIDLLFDNKYYDMLKAFKPYEKDRSKAEKLFRCMQELCVSVIKSGNVSNHRKKILSLIYEEINYYIELISLNANMPLLFSSAVCKFRNYIN